MVRPRHTQRRNNASLSDPIGQHPQPGFNCQFAADIERPAEGLGGFVCGRIAGRCGPLDGGTEMRVFTVHGGRRYAGNGYWEDQPGTGEAHVGNLGKSRAPHFVGCSDRGEPMSELGRVSRAPHGLSAARNCTRDEGGPFGFGDQEPISSHRRLLRAKAVVVSVAETPGQRFRQAWSREASASEPLQKCRKRISRCQNRGVTLPPGSARGMP